MIAILVGNYLNKKKKKDKFTSDVEEESIINMRNMINFVGLVIAIYSLYLFFKCYKLKNEFNVLEFLGSFCYPLIYIIYRLIFTPEEHCILAEAE